MLLDWKHGSLPSPSSYPGSEYLENMGSVCISVLIFINSFGGVSQSVACGPLLMDQTNVGGAGLGIFYIKLCFPFNMY